MTGRTTSIGLTRRSVVTGCGLTLAGITHPWPAFAAGTPHDPVADFYNTLMDGMRHAQEWKVQGRYDRLEPVMLKSFDVAAMVRLAVGHAFDTLSPGEQEQLRSAFGRLLVASFASEFDDFKGEQFTIDDQALDQGGDKLVKTQFHAVGAPVDINYLVHNVDGAWRIIDVYLNGNVSQLATWRSRFGAALKKGGVPAMLQAVKQQTDRYMASI